MMASDLVDFVLGIITKNKREQLPVQSVLMINTHQMQEVQMSQNASMQQVQKLFRNTELETSMHSLPDEV